MHSETARRGRLRYVALAFLGAGRDLRRLGWERAGRAFTRACIDYGAARSRAKRKADG